MIHPITSGKALRLAAMLVTAVSIAGFAQAAGGDAEINSRRASERKLFTDAEIVDGFMKTTFGAEYRVDTRAERIRKFEGPIRVFVDNRAQPDRTREVGAVIGDIRARVADLDIAIAPERTGANFIITLVRDRDLANTIRALYGQERARSIQRSLTPQCLAGITKDDSYRILRSEVILVVDAGEFIFYDCAYEEILQALGPINDTAVPWTMFNDDVSMGFFDVYDQYLLNILYHPRIRPGMTREEANEAAREVLPAVRSFVGKNNKLEP